MTNVMWTVSVAAKTPRKKLTSVGWKKYWPIMRIIGDVCGPEDSKETLKVVSFIIKENNQ